MRLPRVTIRHLMVIIAILGVDFASIAAAFGGPSNLAPVGLYASTMTLLATATLGSSIRRGSERNCWFGVAIFGWSFLLPAIALTMRSDPWTRGGVFIGAQIAGLMGAAVGYLFSEGSP